MVCNLIVMAEWWSCHQFVCDRSHKRLDGIVVPIPCIAVHADERRLGLAGAESTELRMADWPSPYSQLAMTGEVWTSVIRMGGGGCGGRGGVCVSFHNQPGCGGRGTCYCLGRVCSTFRLLYMSMLSPFSYF